MITLGYRAGEKLMEKSWPVDPGQPILGRVHAWPGTVPGGHQCEHNFFFSSRPKNLGVVPVYGYTVPGISLHTIFTSAQAFTHDPLL